MTSVAADPVYTAQQLEDNEKHVRASHVFHVSLLLLVEINERLREQRL